MIDEKIFAHAVTMATAFVENGDIRFDGSTKKDNVAAQMIGGMVESLYYAIQDARQSIEEKL